MKRHATVARKTAETNIQLELELDGSGICEVDCPIGFFEHMLSAFCKHGLFNMRGVLQGDLHVDQHHLIEDTGIVLGTAFFQALGDCAGIYRVGSCLYPMDETLARAAVDFGGRSFLVAHFDVSGIPLVALQTRQNDGVASSFQTDCVEDFWQGFVSTARCNLHLDVLRGRSDHHKIEALFKASGRAIREAITIDSRRQGSIPSTKGILV